MLYAVVEFRLSEAKQQDHVIFCCSGFILGTGAVGMYDSSAIQFQTRLVGSRYQR